MLGKGTLRRLAVGCVSLTLACGVASGCSSAPEVGVNSLGAADESAQLASQVSYIDYDSGSGALFTNDELIVVAAPGVLGTDIEQIASGIGATVPQSLDEIGFYRFRFDDPHTIAELQTHITNLTAHDLVEDGHLNLISFVESAGLPLAHNQLPVLYPYLPAPADWGQDAIGVLGAWEHLDEIEPVKIGLVDVFPYAHDAVDINVIDSPGLTSSQSFAGTALGYHGTEVASIMGSSWDHGGFSGIAGPNAELYYSAIFQSRSSFLAGISPWHDSLDYITALSNLINEGVKVVNVSLSTGESLAASASHGGSTLKLQMDSKPVAKALHRLIDNGHEFIICVGAGNANAPDRITLGVTYTDVEARYNNYLSYIEDTVVKDRIIVVGSIGIDFEHTDANQVTYRYSDFADIGSRIDIVAPGEEVYVATAENSYASVSGTSYSTPMVSGTAALVFGANPELTGAQVKQILIGTERGRCDYQGGHSGLVDAATAVDIALATRQPGSTQVPANSLTNAITALREPTFSAGAPYTCQMP
ncbi:MAG: S8 family serine peptidase [Promicromonosporaceae bacterium]|nr:S8 family serine peptidase [Promicromonosporaceae bacterium]